MPASVAASASIVGEMLSWIAVLSEPPKVIFAAPESVFDAETRTSCSPVSTG